MDDEQGLLDLGSSTSPTLPGWSMLDPLAVRMRPSSLDEVLGQGRILGAGSPLRRMVEEDADLSVVLHGPPGVGKTTIALLLAKETSRRFVEVSATSGSVKELRSVIDDARRLRAQGARSVLFVDEIHRFSRTQQDTLLPAVENRWVSLVAATTENPSFSVAPALVSRSVVVALQPVGDDQVEFLLDRAVAAEQGLNGGVTLEEDARGLIARLAGGDARRALTLLEAAAGGVRVVDVAAVERVTNQATIRYDRDGDQHYDVVSAFVKSIRGSDPDAAVHYLARMLEAGEDPRYVARRLVVHASEDVGLADPTALQAAVAAAQVVALVGMPECRLALTQATLHLALAPKSNSVLRAIDAASGDVRSGRVGSVPPHLRDAHYPGAKAQGSGVGYRYPHGEPGNVVAQEHMPDPLRGREYYQPADSGRERPALERLLWLRQKLRGK